MIYPVRDVVLHEELPDFLQQFDGDHDVRPGRAVCRDPDRSSGRCISHLRHPPSRTVFRSNSTAPVPPDASQNDQVEAPSSSPTEAALTRLCCIANSVQSGRYLCRRSQNPHREITGQWSPAGPLLSGSSNSKLEKRQRWANCSNVTGRPWSAWLRSGCAGRRVGPRTKRMSPKQLYGAFAGESGKDGCRSWQTATISSAS